MTNTPGHIAQGTSRLMNNDIKPVAADVPGERSEAPVTGQTGGETQLPSWLQRQLARVYSSVVQEPLPPDLMALVRKLEENATALAPRESGPRDE